MTAGVPRYWKSFRRWLTTPLGRTLIREEDKIISGIVSKLFGYHFLLIGDTEFSSSLESSAIVHKAWVYPMVEGVHSSLPIICSRIDKLAILSDEIDLVYLAHCLESIKNPHEVLREAYRIIRPEGHLIISCFTPFSLWNIWRWMIRLFKRPAWDGKFLSSVRLKDWLALLGFDIVQVRNYFYRPPIQHEKTMKRLMWMERLGKMFWPFSGASTIILAKKRVLTLTPILAQAKNKQKVLASGLVEPVVRSDFES